MVCDIVFIRIIIRDIVAFARVSYFINFILLAICL